MIERFAPFDSKSKPAQFWRLQSRGEEIMTVKELNLCDVTELMRYIRIGKGKSNSELFKDLAIKREMIADWEIYGITPSPKHLEKLIQYFGFAEHSVLPQIFRMKAQDTTALIPNTLLAQVVSKVEPILFAHEEGLTIAYKPTQQEERAILQVMERRYVPSDKDREVEINATDKLWLRTLSQPGMTLGKAIKFLRLSRGLLQREFAEEAGVKKARLYLIEGGYEKTRFDTLHKIVNASPIRELENDSMTLQFLRLQALGEKVMNMHELQHCSFGTLIKYLMILKGVEREELGDALFYSSTGIGGIRSDRKSINEIALTKFITYLGLTDDDPLAKLINIKAHNLVIKNKSLVKSAIRNGYLFDEYLQSVNTHTLSEKEQTLLGEMKGINSFGKMIRFLRQKEYPTVASFARRVTIRPQKIGEIEESKRIPFDVTAMELLRGLGFDIHSPITWKLLDQLDKENPNKKRE